MFLIYEFFGMEYEFEVPYEILKEELKEVMEERELEDVEDVLNDFDLMDDVRSYLYEKCEKMALEECIDARECAMDRDFYYGVNRND